MLPLNFVENIFNIWPFSKKFKPKIFVFEYFPKIPSDINSTHPFSTHTVFTYHVNFLYCCCINRMIFLYIFHCPSCLSDCCLYICLFFCFLISNLIAPMDNQILFAFYCLSYLVALYLYEENLVSCNTCPITWFYYFNK